MLASVARPLGVAVLGLCFVATVDVTVRPAVHKAWERLVNTEAFAGQSIAIPSPKLRGAQLSNRNTTNLEEDMHIHLDHDQKVGSKNGKFGDLLVLVFGLVFYYQVVRYYPFVHGPNTQSTAVMNENAFRITFGPALCNANFLLSCCCLPARLGLNLHATGVFDYWAAFLASFCCPCPTTWYAMSATDMHELLGGQREPCCQGCLWATFCNCCAVLKQAEAVDAATGMKTEFCGVVPMAPVSVVTGEPLLRAEQALRLGQVPENAVMQ
eukprot:gb/GFBE01075463.1/.p1 GENE.gb/GFBE01075463.1/~~gb/GFBE01075463.1/.p1  ORF type:complete len:268 (+),score=38.82 gb/GFBE01075463.1/:1-804(+)